MGYKIAPWLRCSDCGKIHTRAYIGPNTCTCGNRLWRAAWGCDETGAATYSGLTWVACLVGVVLVLGWGWTL